MPGFHRALILKRRDLKKNLRYRSSGRKIPVHDEAAVAASSDILLSREIKLVKHYAIISGEKGCITISWQRRAILDGLPKPSRSSLRSSRVAIAGLGGVGGAHAVTLARLGVGKFHLSDFDEYEIHNFNRQIGANMQTIGRPKLDVIREQVLSINPEAEISTFPEGVNADNVEQFLDGVDLYVDSLDFFVMEARKTVFRACHRNQIPAITAAPLGMGCAFLAIHAG